MTYRELTAVTWVGAIEAAILLGLLCHCILSVRKLERRSPRDFPGYKYDSRGILTGGLTVTGVIGALLVFGSVIPLWRNQDAIGASMWLVGCLLIMGNVLIVPSASRYCRVCNKKLEIFRNASPARSASVEFIFACRSCHSYYSLAWLTVGIGDA